MPRTETSNYLTARQPFQTSPRDLVRLHFVRKAGDGVDYPFTTDFTMHDVLSPTTSKLKCLGLIQGSTQRVDVIQRRAEIGTFTIPLADRDREITRYVSDPAVPLRVAVNATDVTGAVGGFIIGIIPILFAAPSAGTLTRLEVVGSVRGYPTRGTVTIDAEDCKYTTKGVGYVSDSSVINQFTGTTIGVVTPRQGGPGAGLPYGILFDGSATNHILMGNVPLGLNVTIEAWIKTTTTAQRCVYSKRASGTGRIYFGVSGGGFFLYSNDAAAGITSNKLINDSLWHHVVWTSNGTTSTLYVDGVLDRTETQSRVAAGTQTAYIAHDPENGTSENFPGTIAALAVYSSVLTLARVQSHIAAMRAGGYLADILTDAPVAVWLLDEDQNAFTGLTRAYRGTTAAAHAVGAIIHNGEQIRRGQRLAIHTGYESLAEVDYGPGPCFQKLEVTELRYDSQQRLWTIFAADIQRYTKRMIFEFASELDPVLLGPAHPITLGLQVLLSTGKGTNGPYDVLPIENGAAVAQQLVDVAGLERLKNQDLAWAPNMTFREDQPREAKGFFEDQILGAVNCVPHITQDGKISARRFGQPVFRDSGIVQAWRVVSYT